MGVKRWVAAAATVAKVSTVTVGGTAANGQVYTVTMGLNSSKTVSYTATGADTNTTIAAALYALLAASTYGEFTKVTWSYPGSGAVITATAKTAGTPFTNTSSATGTGTLVTATTTANSSPNSWATAANWDANAVPVTGDDVYIDLQNGTDILFDLDQHTVTLNSLNILASFSRGQGGNGTIGLPEWNADGYPEYLDTYLKIGATAVNIGRGTGAGSPRLKLDFGTVATTVSVFATGQSQDLGVAAVCLKGTNAANVFNIFAGQVQLAGFSGESATAATLQVGPTPAGAVAPGVYVGPGATCTTINQESGVLVLSAGCTTLSVRGGACVVTDTPTAAANVTTANVAGGALDYQGRGTITNLNVFTGAGGGGTVTFDSVFQARTVTNLKCWTGYSVSDRYGSVTYTNAPQFVECSPAGWITRENVSLALTYLP